MLKALIRSRIAALFSALFRGSKRGKKRSPLMKIGVAVLAIYVNISLFLAFGTQFRGIGSMLAEAGVNWLYFGFAGIMAFAFMFVGSVFTTQRQIFEAKDNALLLSMPIPPSMILASRMAGLYVFNLLFETYIFLPAGVVYCFMAPVNPAGVVFYILIWLLLPLFALSLSCVFGWLMALISGRVRNKSLFVTVFSILFFLLYFSAVGNYDKFIQIAAASAALAGKIKTFALPVFWLGSAAANGSFIHFLLFALFCLLPFAAVFAVLSAGFLRIATAQRGFAKIKYQERSLSVRSAKSALFFKELKHFAASPMYMLNAAFGDVAIVGGAIYLLVKFEAVMELLEQMPQFAPYLAPALVAALCALATTNFISAPSVSLEGKNLWLALSLPVDGTDVLFAKVYLHIAVTLPALLFAQIVAAVLFPMEPVYLLLLFLLPALVTVFCALFGVVINLQFPKFDWINETAAVKQSMSSFIAMLGGFSVILAPALVYGTLLAGKLDAGVFLILVGAVLAAVCALMVRYLKRGGKERFASLG